jgi:hypothetical protein
MPVPPGFETDPDSWLFLPDGRGLHVADVGPCLDCLRAGRAGLDFGVYRTPDGKVHVACPEHWRRPRDAVSLGSFDARTCLFTWIEDTRAEA